MIVNRTDSTFRPVTLTFTDPLELWVLMRMLGAPNQSASVVIDDSHDIPGNLVEDSIRDIIDGMIEYDTWQALTEECLTIIGKGNSNEH